MWIIILDNLFVDLFFLNSLSLFSVFFFHTRSDKKVIGPIKVLKNIYSIFLVVEKTRCIDWFQWHFKTFRVILSQEVRELSSLYIYVYISWKFLFSHKVI